MATLDQPVSRRERQVLDMIVEGLATPEMAARLYVSESTIKTYRLKLFQKLGATTAAQAVHHAHLAGVLDGGGLASANAEDLEMLRLARELGCRITLVRTDGQAAR